VRALLTNWSIVPHACLFRRSILEKAGGFPEDIWVGEDQLLFLRCLLAGAKVVHSPGTMVYYRLGNDPGKLTATGAAQKRHARDWGKFWLKANQEVTSGEWRVTSAGKKTCVTTEDTESTERAQGGDQGTCAGAAFSNPFTSELARDCEITSLTRSASGPAGAAAQPSVDGAAAALDGEPLRGGSRTEQPRHRAVPRKHIEDGPKGAASRERARQSPSLHGKALDSGRSTLDATTPPAEWYAFRLRAYEAWRDLERFFPDGELELKSELEGIWKKSRFSVFSFQFSGFFLRNLAGLKLRVLGYREHGSFKCAKFSASGWN